VGRIVLVVALGMAGAGFQGASATVLPRKNFGMCLNKFVEDKASDKLAEDAFKTAAQAACAKEAAAFRTAWVSYEVSMKTKRADAEQNASSQVDDYLSNAIETYKEMQEPVKPK
jgi:hypothetical protein